MFCLKGGVAGEEALSGGTKRLEALHLPFSSSDRLMRVLRPVVLPQALLMAGRESNNLEGSPIGAEFVGHHDGRGGTVFLEQHAHQLHRGSSVSPARHEAVEDLAFVIHRPPEIDSLARDADHHLATVPRSARLRMRVPQAAGRERTDLSAPARRTASEDTSMPRSTSRSSTSR